MSLRPKWQKLRRRHWVEMRDSWLFHIPRFPSVGARPDPGLEHLEPLLGIDVLKDNGRFPDVPGLRTLTLWEAVFLFHKCSHTNLAAQRLGQQGMHSWCLFNAYHSAYLGARGIMSLLGIALPNLKGSQVAIDLYPEPLKETRLPMGAPQFQEFLIVPLPPLDQRHLWEAFQRVLRMSEASCWDTRLRQELLDVSYEKITPPRNRFLYRAHYWPLNDLISDVEPPDLTGFIGTDLVEEDPGFLLRLSFDVYRLFEQLMSDLAAYSAIVEEQLKTSRFLWNSEVPDVRYYRDFLSQLHVQAESLQGT